MRARSKHLAASAALCVVLAALFACSGKEGRACYQGDWVACPCGDAGMVGYAQCGPNETFPSCDCSGNYPFLPDAGIVADAPADAASDAPAGITQPCMTTADCAAGLECYPFNARGPRCTHPCKVDTDCEAPSPGCSMMGVCKSG
jgi:hypothetical protein